MNEFMIKKKKKNTLLKQSVLTIFLHNVFVFFKKNKKGTDPPFPMIDPSTPVIDFWGSKTLKTLFLVLIKP
jgi:hypothetical protein